MNRHSFARNFKLGIIGGGQLGKMLLREAQRYNLFVKILDPSAQAPARTAASEFVQGSLTDFDTVMAFGEDCDHLTIEIENVNVEALAKLEQQGKKVYPRPSLIKLIQNKCDQKDFYRQHQIPTAAYQNFNATADLRVALERDELKLPLVWKAATGGFDGRGVHIVRALKDLENLDPGACLAEQLVDFSMEIGVVVARAADGRMEAFPPVEMEFHPEANQVEYVLSPARISADIAKKATALAKDLAAKLEITGVLAVELFLTTDGDLLVNEVAPRVHNSGHLSMEGHSISQFDQHLRAVCEWPLAKVVNLRPAVMINLVGEEGPSGPAVYQSIDQALAEPETYVHLYGKAKTRPFRKMGHITVTAASLEEAREKAEKLKKRVKVISA